MRDLLAAVMLIGLLSACGGKHAATPQVAAERSPRASEPTVEAEEAAPEPAPAITYAKAALTPVKGSRLKPTIVSFTHRAGEDTRVDADAFNGAKPGIYWLVIHDGSACGANATKAGAVWSGLPRALRVVIDGDLTGGLEAPTVKLALDGDAGAIGRVLVLHEDKKGSAGKPLACGVIEQVEEP